MLLIEEIGRLLAQLLGYTIGTRRFGMLLLVAVCVAVVALSAATTTVTPVALYPFI